MVALLAFELQAQGVFELASQLVEGGQFAAAFEAQARGARLTS